MDGTRPKFKNARIVYHYAYVHGMNFAVEPCYRVKQSTFQWLAY